MYNTSTYILKVSNQMLIILCKLKLFIYFNFRVFELLSAPLRRCCYLEFKAMKSGHLLLLNNILDLIESLEPSVYLSFYTDALHKLLGIFLTIISVSNFLFKKYLVELCCKLTVI